MEDILIPICVCVILPVAIVLIVGLTKRNETNRKAEIMLKAIEAGVPVDPAMFKTPEKSPKTIRQELLEKLTGACITGLMGIAFLVLWTVDQFGPGIPKGFFFSEMLPVAGGVMLAVGIALLISYFAGKKLLAGEMDAQEKALSQTKE